MIKKKEKEEVLKFDNEETYKEVSEFKTLFSREREKQRWKIKKEKNNVKCEGNQRRYN